MVSVGIQAIQMWALLLLFMCACRITYADHISHLCIVDPTTTRSSSLLSLCFHSSPTIKLLLVVTAIIIRIATAALDGLCPQSFSITGAVAEGLRPAAASPGCVLVQLALASKALALTLGPVMALLVA